VRLQYTQLLFGECRPYAFRFCLLCAYQTRWLR
jgi:hypothetical protein